MSIRKKVTENGIIYDVLETDKWKAYYLNGVRHRKNRPALVWKQAMDAYFINGELHRSPLNGPAIIYHKDYLKGEKLFFENGIQKHDDKPVSSANVLDLKEFSYKVRKMKRNRNTHEQETS